MATEEKYLEMPWVKSHGMGCIPKTLEYPEISYTEFHLDEPARKWPNTLALVQFDYEMTYKELKDKVDRFATALSDLGVKKGDVVFIMLPTSIQDVICDMAIPKIGAIHSPGSFLDSIDEIVGKLERIKCDTVICCHTNVKDRDVIDKVKEVAKRYPLKNIILTHTRDFSSSPPEHEREENVVWFTDLIEKYPPNPPKVDIDVKKDVAILFFTGGTTGIPKSCMLSHYNMVAHSIQMSGSLFPQSVLSLAEGLGIRISATAPLFHAMAHSITIMFLSLGETLLLQEDPRDAKEFIRLVKKYHPITTTGTSPTQFMKALDEKDAKGLGMLPMSGSMALAPKTQRDYEKKTGSIIGEGYGLTEFGPVTHGAVVAFLFAPIVGSRETVAKIFHLLNRILETPGIIPLLRVGARLIGPENIGLIANTFIAFVSSNILVSSFGRKKEQFRSIGAPWVDIKMKIIDEDTEETIPMEKVVKEGKRGEMCLDGPNKMLGYWPNPGSGFDDEGYVHTGDIVKVDEWGYTYIVDRTKDMVNVSGYKVYTREIDDLLYEIPDVSEVATVGIPDPDRSGSERLKVFIVPLPEYRGKMRGEDIIDYLREKVAKYAVPKSVEFRDKLPKTVMEKISKRKLREEEIEKMKREGLLK